MSPGAPLPVHEETVRPEWIDRNGHMNLAYYVVAFDHATDLVFDALGIGEAYSESSGNSLFIVETHILYERELRAGERVRVRSRLIGADAKRLHLAHEMFAAGETARAAMQELLALHVDMSARRAAPFPPDRLARIGETAAAHALLPRPERLGRRIAMPGR